MSEINCKEVIKDIEKKGFVRFKELYIFGLNAGKDQKNTLKFIDGSIALQSLYSSQNDLRFDYTSATTKEIRSASFIKSNISGYSYTVNKGK